MNARRVSAVLASALAATTFLGLAPAQASVHTTVSKADVAGAGEAHTILKVRGSKAVVNKRWWPMGNGTYGVLYWGTVYDTSADGARAEMFRLADGQPVEVAEAVGADRWEPFRQEQSNVRKLHLQVCTHDAGAGRRWCSDEW